MPLHNGLAAKRFELLQSGKIALKIAIQDDYQEVDLAEFKLMVPYHIISDFDHKPL